ncbi:sulfotransferase family 2 domain-containing protein [Amaricoccus sp.]|uniref:sulfotransferase family 2 domain-containing protein n=1 Tax=Amaricoccus sp. TaxID=1872485 RepID=UPI001B61CAD3|nr:sulfotransferase family 2 domain-containing protein [Amaricoccus sp.]MBP7242588.1 sulfotransferase family 2 domain-containing protein [Amaricoccus sp.]
MVPDPVPLVDPVRRFVLFTNAKCGGATLKSWFFANLDIPRLEQRPVAFLRAFGPAYAWRHLRRGRKITPRGAGLLDVAKVRRMTNFYRKAFSAPAMEAGVGDCFKFAVVRHPEDRVVSSFIDKVCGADRNARWVKDMLVRAGHGDAISFDGFLDYLETADETTVDPHWRRQSYILEGHRMDAWVRLEHLAEDFAHIGPRVGAAHLDVFSRRLQSNAYDPASMEAALAADMPSMSSRDVIAWAERHGAFPPKEAFLTDATRSRIRRIFAKDFDLLPYGASGAATET